MCNSRNSTEVKLCVPRKYSGRTTIKVDKCLAPLIQFLNDLGVHTLGACCGHGEFNPSIIAEHEGRQFDVFSGIEVGRLRRYYKRDKNSSFYHIPEVRGVTDGN